MSLFFFKPLLSVGSGKVSGTFKCLFIAWKVNKGRELLEDGRLRLSIVFFGRSFDHGKNSAKVFTPLDVGEWEIRRKESEKLHEVPKICTTQLDIVNPWCFGLS